jgi:hypothetical protein
MSTNHCEMAIEILQATHDGDHLDPADLKLVELAVNGFLSEPGKVAFVALHANATKAGGYTRPWFLGITHMTRDHERYIYWKGVRVEHFDHNVWREAGWRERMLSDAEQLATRCQVLEEMDEIPTLSSASLRWEDCIVPRCRYPARFLSTGPHDGQTFTAEGKPKYCRHHYEEQRGVPQVAT